MKTLKDYHKIIFDTTPHPAQAEKQQKTMFDMCVLSWLMLHQHNYS